MTALDRLGGRRFLLALLAQLSSNLLVWHGKIGGEVYSVVILATVAAYITGNVAQRRIEAGKPVVE
jgi:hypothetical protein